MECIHKDKTIGHIHTDPKLIIQPNCKSILSIGMLVYLNPNNELYLPAISTDEEITSNVQGIIWNFVGDDKFLLKILPGPMEYRFPLPKEFFNISGNTITPNITYIPGNYGDRLWLSETKPGRMQSNKPTFPNIPLIVGYKTPYGFLYQPKYICCSDDNMI